MNRWADFDAARILYEDADLIAVDKPEGVSSQSADPEHPDDLVYRLRRFLAARDGAEPYLGIHQRLDQDSSGVIVYTKRREANASLAKQLEGRTAEKRYLALVEDWPGRDRTLSHMLAPDGARMRVAPRDRRRKNAVSHVRVRSRAGGRTLLEVRIETGRTHQIRAQLAAEGAPIVGDRIYGGVAAPRLMLHAWSIALSHPISGAPLTIEAPIPTLFERAPTLRESIEHALARRWGLAHREDVTAFRLVNEAGDWLRGIAVDAYADWLVLHVYSAEIEAELERVLDALSLLGYRGIYVKRRPKQANVIVDAQQSDLAPSMPLRGEPAPDPLVVLEHGVPYRVRLGEGLSTGLFLDQRENRRRVRELAQNATVLNLFAYSCAFTVAAAAGGARASLSVDASKRAIERGRENLEGAGLATAAHRFLVADVFEALEDLARRRERFDLVCVDPPTYSTTRASRWKSGSDWPRLAALAFAVLAPGGRLLACSNDRRLRQNELRRHVHEGARIAKIELAQMKDLPCPADFPAPFGEEAHLKSLLCTRR